jgi:biopolymer transport protein ExbB
MNKLFQKPWIRAALFLALLLFFVMPAMAQTGVPKSDAPVRTGSFRELIVDGGTIGFIIIILGTVAIGFGVEHALTIRASRLMPEEAVDDLTKMIKERKVDDAIAYCESREHPSLLTNVVLAGLYRFKGSEYGYAEYRAAVEEAGEEQTNRLYRKTEVLAVIGAIAPMLGLLGTVQGMIEAFNTIASTGGAATPADLASSISKALVTTFEGLVVAIPVLSALSFFRTRIDHLVAEAGSRVEHLLMPLSRPK